MPNPVKIALTGRMRSGKDAVAAHLTQQYGFVRFAFGDELKRYAHKLFDVPHDSKPRELYQWFGQTMRQRDPEIWVRKLFEIINVRIRSHEILTKYLGVDDVCNIVVTDARQPNEYERLRAEGFVIIRVNASDETRIQRMIDAGDTFDERDLTHETELYSDGFAVDYEIENNGSLAELHAKVDEIMSEIMAKGSGMS